MVSPLKICDLFVTVFDFGIKRVADLGISKCISICYERQCGNSVITKLITL